MIRAKVGKCSDCSRETALISRRCKYCYWKHREMVKRQDKERKEAEREIVESPEEQKVYIIPKQSDKRKKQNTLYLKKRRIFMEQNTKCQAGLKGCTIEATELHHKKGRMNELIHDERYFLAVCRSCHEKITEHSRMAIEKGLSLSRYGS